MVLPRKTGPDGMRKFGRNSQVRGVLKVQEEDAGGADRVRAASGGRWNSKWRRPVVVSVSRCLGASFHRRKKVYPGMGVAKIRRPKQLEEENAKLKRQVADLLLDKTMLLYAEEGRSIRTRSPKRRRTRRYRSKSGVSTPGTITRI